MVVEGHVLLEGPPGLGKTLLARTVAAATGLHFDRVQCTPDLMPADVTGTTVLVQDEAGHRQLVFRRGPIFAQIVLVDEINRAVPRTQSAMLEAMQERTVTVGTTTHALPRPFVVLATQNPTGDAGTYRLPEAQRDRFLVQVRIGQPSEAVLQTLLDRTTGEPGPAPRCRLAPDFLPNAATLVRRVFVAEHLRRWVANVIVACDVHGKQPLSGVADQLDVAPGPRAGQALLAMARVGALSEGRAAIGRMHICQVAEVCLRHRMQVTPGAMAAGLDADALIKRLLDGVPVPTPHEVLR
jgi:MoxR-like ATPase